MASIYNVHADFHSAFEDREPDFCVEHLATAAELLQAAIAKLEAQAKAYNDGGAADIRDCDRARRILSSSKHLIRLINGTEIQLPKF